MLERPRLVNSLSADAIVAAGIDLDGVFDCVAGDAAIGLAVSGGVDSLALLLLADVWAKNKGRTVHVFSVDHGLRTEAGQEAAWVGQLATELGHQFHLMKWGGDKPFTGMQAAAREARYDLMGEKAAALGLSAIITAHHANDQAETLLMRMAHKSGLRGLAGMREQQMLFGVKIMRPLLGCSRAQLAAIVDAAGLTPVADPSNADEHFERVRWRKLMPQLAREGLDAESLGLLATRMQRADEALDYALEAVTHNVVRNVIFGAVCIDRDAFSRLPAELQIRLLTNTLEAVNGAGAYSVKLAQIETLAMRILDVDFVGSSLCGGRVQASGDLLIAFREAGRLPLEKFTLAPGDMRVWDGRFAIDNQCGEPMRVSAAETLTREQAEAFLDHPVAVPMAALRVLVQVRNLAGDLVGLGDMSRLDGLNICLAEKLPQSDSM